MIQNLRSLALCAVLLVAGFVVPLSPAFAQAGAVAATLPFKAVAMIADPVRPRMYATVAETNSVHVVDTTTLTVTATVFTGSAPLSLVISPDGNSLYVLNTGSTVAAIGVLDLNTLQARPSLTLPDVPAAIAAGLDGRVYALLPGLDRAVYPDHYGCRVYQIDAVTNTVQTVYSLLDTVGTFLQASPDGRTLYLAGGADIRLYDVSTPTLVTRSESIPIEVTSYGEFVQSLSGRRLGFLASRPDQGTAAGTILYDQATADRQAPLYQQDSYLTTQIQFSPDDTLFYKLTGFSVAGFKIESYDPETLTRIAKTEVVSPFDGYYGFYPGAFAVDNTGSYFFMGQSNADRDSHDTRAPLTVVLKTGRGTLEPITPLPTVSVRAVAPSVSYQAGQDGSFILERTGDVSQPLLVRFHFGGTATYQDFEAADDISHLIKAGHTRARIRMHLRKPWNESTIHTAKLTLQDTPFYTRGKPRRASVTIYP